ncbi:hypothetical protein [Nonomuraea wenchangensis]|uniref:Uncharacterized protein n=1 Tax=Nonomuraea wenchangensis TaxID=568860 RepID=A0A1I0LEW0_9ACTN|nr:hypothetical protein [Nonomuraea wenchangensis]SEU38702.1 hypothetical protein SAMN05421811_1168 [Nonomuraea wenchangensis]
MFKKFIESRREAKADRIRYNEWLTEQEIAMKRALDEMRQLRDRNAEIAERVPDFRFQITETL